MLAALAANVATEEKAAEAQFISRPRPRPLSASMAAVTAADALYPFLKQSEEPLNAAGVPPNYMMRNKLASPLASPDTSTHSGSNFGYLSAHDMSSSQQVDEPPTTGATFNSPSHQPWPVLLTTRECAARAASSELDTAAAQWPPAAFPRLLAGSDRRGEQRRPGAAGGSTTTAPLPSRQADRRPRTPSTGRAQPAARQRSGAIDRGNPCSRCRRLGTVCKAPPTVPRGRPSHQSKLLLLRAAQSSQVGSLTGMEAFSDQCEEAEEEEDDFEEDVAGEAVDVSEPSHQQMAAAEVVDEAAVTATLLSQAKAHAEMEAKATVAAAQAAEKPTRRPSLLEKLSSKFTAKAKLANTPTPSYTTSSSSSPANITTITTAPPQPQTSSPVQGMEVEPRAQTAVEAATALLTAAIGLGPPQPPQHHNNNNHNRRRLRSRRCMRCCHRIRRPSPSRRPFLWHHTYWSGHHIFRGTRRRMLRRRLRLTRLLLLLLRRRFRHTWRRWRQRRWRCSSRRRSSRRRRRNNNSRHHNRRYYKRSRRSRAALILCLIHNKHRWHLHNKHRIMERSESSGSHKTWRR